MSAERCPLFSMSAIFRGFTVQYFVRTKCCGWGLFYNYMTLSCLYPKFRWLISHDRLSFQPLLVNVFRRLSDSRGDMAVPVRIKFITLCMFQNKFLISFTPVTCLSCYRIILVSSLINFTYSRMGFVDTLNLFLFEYSAFLRYSKFTHFDK